MGTKLPNSIGGGLLGPAKASRVRKGGGAAPKKTVTKRSYNKPIKWGRIPSLRGCLFRNSPEPAKLAAKNALKWDSLRCNNGAMLAIVFTDPQGGKRRIDQGGRAQGHSGGAAR